LILLLKTNFFSKSVFGAFQIVAGWWDTSQGSPPWAVSPPPTATNGKRQFEMHPIYTW